MEDLTPSLTDRQVREKLVLHGAAELTDAELLSILLRDSRSGMSATEQAARLLNRFRGSLARMGRCDLATLRTTENLGIARAATLAAALELARRLHTEESLAADTVHTDADVIGIFRPLLADLPHEEFWALYLNASNRVLDRIRISQGGVTGTVVDYKLIVKRAVERLAQGILLVHNHPSGNPLPSDADTLITEKLVRAASLFEIIVADHVIITSGECYSFRSHGFFDRL